MSVPKSIATAGTHSGNAMPIQVEIRHLYAAVILAEELNFTRAARRLQMSQPRLSKLIMEVENEHGFKLFVRDRKRPARLTEAGCVFVQEARYALLHADRAIHLARVVHYQSQGLVPDEIH